LRFKFSTSNAAVGAWPKGNKSRFENNFSQKPWKTKTTTTETFCCSCCSFCCCRWCSTSASSCRHWNIWKRI